MNSWERERFEEQKVFKNCALWFTVACVFTVATWVLSFVIYAGEISYTAELQLADDASTPEKKAEYLGKFIDKTRVF